MGVTPKLLLLAVRSSSSLVGIFHDCLRSSVVLQRFPVRGRLLGKTAAKALPIDTRAILPLCSVLTVVDALLAVYLKEFLQTVLPESYEYFEGAMPKKQVLDVAFSCFLVVEKALDMWSRGAICAGDVHKFYDKVSLVIICQWLEGAGADPGWCAALARFHATTPVELEFCNTRVCFADRVKGALTGTRSANILARIPVCVAIAKVRRDNAFTGFPLPGYSLKFSSWVDNIFTFSSSP